MKNTVRAALVFFIFALAMAGAARLCSAAEYRVRKLAFSGAHDILPSALKKTMDTRAPSWYSRLPFVKLPAFDQGVFDNDIDSIRNYYQSHGYYHASVKPDIRIDGKKRAVDISIHVDEGSPVSVRDIAVQVRDGSVPEDELYRLLALRKGIVLRIDDYNASRIRLENHLVNSGYANAAVSGKIVVHKKDHAADVTFIAAPGSRQRFGTVFISGNETVRDRDILREVAFKEGGIFSQALVNETQRRIFRTNLFSSVMVEAEINEDGDIVPVSVDLEERGKHSALLGLGYGNEDRFRVNAQWTKRYLFNSLRTLDLSFRYSSLILTGAADLKQPHFIDPHSDLLIHASYERDYLPSYSNERIVAQMRVGRALSDTVETYIGYNQELNRPVSVSESLLRQLLETNPGDYYFISGIQLGIQYDTVRDKLSPKSGTTCSIFVEPATFLLGSKLDYLRSVAEARFFRQLFPRYIGALRARAGFIEPSRFTRDIPVFKRFFSGGGSTVRGYSYQSLGPVDASGTAIGGHYLFEGNAEIRYPVYKELSGVVFLDGGNVFQNKIDLKDFDLKYGTGAGLRYNTIVGPLRVDLAFPLDPGPTLAISRYAIYFSLGNAF